MDIFDFMREQNEKSGKKESPLARRLRPTTLSDIVGQEHILGPGKMLTRAIQADKLSSVILYGPPGTGKTSLAYVIANTTKAEFKEINATTSGKKDMEAVVAGAKDALSMYGRKTILFVDEIHRFNKAQQDFLLPYVEDGTVILIGATTENPYFEVNGALISRSTVFRLNLLSRENIETLIRRAVTDKERGMGVYNAEISEEAVVFLADMAEGDARQALNAVELAVLTTPPDEKTGKIFIDVSVAEECIQRRNIHYDKEGDNHYDTISAFIKSMRGSDPDAAVYYLAKMLYAGESVTFIARRIMICASEDVGNADPQALQVAVAAAQAVERVGMPESQLILAHAAIYVASAPKSNAVTNAIYAAMNAVKEYGGAEVPLHLRDAHYGGAKDLGHVGYLYAHDFPEHFVKQQYLPDPLVGSSFYEPTEMGREAEIKKWLKHLRTKTDKESE